MKIIKNISKTLKKMPKYQQILLGVILGYIVYKIYCNVEKFTNDATDQDKQDMDKMQGEVSDITPEDMNEPEEEEKVVVTESAPVATKFAAEAGKKAASFLKSLL